MAEAEPVLELAEPLHVPTERRRGGPKRVKDFELTLSQSSLCKAHVWSALEEFCSALVVAEEVHEDGGRHFHVYMSLHEPARITELSETVRSNLYLDEEQESVHISTLRNTKHWIKYITKEDTDPLHKGVDTSGFHQSWRIFNFIRSSEVFDPLAPFVRQQPGLIKILERQHAHYWAGKYNRQFLKTVADCPAQPDYKVGWVSTVDLLVRRGISVYLWGISGCGKTVLGNTLLANLGGISLPCGNTVWEFGEITSQTNLAVAADVGEDYLKHHRQTILRLLDHSMCVVNVKCGGMKTVYYKGSLLVCSNYPFPEGDAALSRRFAVVECNGHNGVRFPLPEIIQVKEEVPEDETIEIPSSDSEEERMVRTPSPTLWDSDDDGSITDTQLLVRC